MKNNRRYIYILIVLLLLFQTMTFGTSWGKLSANEVIERIELIVEGKYVIPENTKKWKVHDIWIPFEFEVDKYYGESGDQKIIAAIEQFDVNWSKDFQEQGGKFVLFLYKDKEEFWIPVAGPNGMIQIMNGDIKNQTIDDSKAYRTFFISVTSKLSQFHKMKKR